MVTRFLLLVVSVLLALPQARAQRALNAVLLSAVPKGAYCDGVPSCVAAVSFRLLETLRPGARARDTIWLYIMCPENFSPGFWTVERTYELQVSADTSTLKKLSRLSVPQKQPLGIVAHARRTQLR